jgi:outer membrane protein OmpA-like peptidoglycan-associated protein
MHSIARGVALCSIVALGACAPRPGPSSLLTLRRVVLNQSGSGYFERTGRVTDDRLALRLRSHEVDDVLATLTVIERGAGAGRAAVAAGVPHGSSGGSINLDLRFADRRARDLMVAYAVPTANWQTTYRVVMPERQGGPALLQVWALVHNSSDEDWNRVELTLATGAPLSFAFHLRNPTFAARPDASGSTTTQVAYGAVTSETTARGRGGVSIHAYDPGPGSAALGGADRDGDRIPDHLDRCINEPETYNGTSDEDGCPDRGQVVIEESQLRILDRISFRARSAELEGNSTAILQAVAATIQNNPQIRVLEVEGHASEDEPNPWPLSVDRASAVRARLVALGVPAVRLRTTFFGATRPISPGATPRAREQNRLVTFNIVPDDGERSNTTPRGSVTVSAAAANAGAQASASQFEGAARFTVAEPVSINAGSAALVTLASREIAGEDVYLFRPEPAAPASSMHPYRAARLRNSLGLALMPGPVALFSQGTFAGQGILRRIEDGETAFVPYSIDSSTRVSVEPSDRTAPLRVVSATRTELVLEDTQIHTTRFNISAGAQSASRIFLRHDHLPGYESRGLPPGSEAGTEADIVPIPLTAGQESTIAIEQRRNTRRTASLLEDLQTDLEPYLRGSSDAVRQQLRAILDQRAALARAEREARELREQLTDVSDRNNELRESLRTLTAVTDATRVALRTQLTQQLQASVARGATLSSELAARTVTASTVRTQLIEALRALRIEEQPGPTQ